MATYSWDVPAGNTITGSTYIKDTDNKIQTTINDLVDFVNGTGTHTGQGLAYDLVDKTNSQTITGIKTFSNGIVSNVTGNVTGSLTGNASTATALQTARNIQLTGDVTGSVSFNGTANAVISTTIVDDSHNHTTANVDGLDATISTIETTLADKVSKTDYATDTVGGVVKMRLVGTTLYITNNGLNA